MSGYSFSHIDDFVTHGLQDFFLAYAVKYQAFNQTDAMKSIGLIPNILTAYLLNLLQRNLLWGLESFCGKILVRVIRLLGQEEYCSNMGKAADDVVAKKMTDETAGEIKIVMYWIVEMHNNILTHGLPNGRKRCGNSALALVASFQVVFIEKMNVQPST